MAGTDTWIEKNSQVAPEKLHALGVIAYRWNLAEIALKSLLIGVARVEFAKLWTIIHEMGDISIRDSIKEMTKQNPLPFKLQAALDHGLELYEVNRINRNQLTHFLPGAIIGADLTRLKGPSFNPQPLPDTVEDLRRVAEDIERLLIYFSKLVTFIYAQQYPRPKPDEASWMQLPDTIPLPERLWKPPPPNPQGRKEPPGKAPG